MNAAPMVNRCYRHQHSELFGGPFIPGEATPIREREMADTPIMVDPRGGREYYLRNCAHEACLR